MAERLNAHPALNPLCQKLGEYVKRVREARGLKVEDVARQLGMATGAYALIEQGRLVPAPWLQERIKRWMWEGVSFEGHQHPKTYHIEAMEKRWHKSGVYLEPKLRQKLVRESRRIGLTCEELIVIAIQRFLSAPAQLTTIRAAVEEIHRVQMIEILRNHPDFRAILEGDVELACQIAGPDIAPAPVDKIGLEGLVEEIEQKTAPKEDAEQDGPQSIDEWSETEELT